MRLVLLTNMPSQHQAELGAELASILGVDNFRLVFAEPTSESREEMGWSDPFRAPYILRAWESEYVQAEIARWINDADVVVQGRYPIDRIRGRLLQGKLTFAYQERFWKRPYNFLRLIARLPRIYKRYWSVRADHYHLLAAGAYVASDLARVGMFKKMAWKFGYFMSASQTSAKAPAPASGNGPLKLLWCARFAPVKRVQDALQILRLLRQHKVNAELNLIGDGELRDWAEEQAQDLADSVSFLGWQPADVVAEQMRRADVFLMTSGFGEGWAMVINEAQNAGCMVVANESVGAAPWLIDDGKNGLLYQQGDLTPVVRRLTALDRAQIAEMGEAARRSHATLWSAPVAARRLVDLSAALLSDKPESARELFADGPCSSAG